MASQEFRTRLVIGLFSVEDLSMFLETIIIMIRGSIRTIIIMTRNKKDQTGTGPRINAIYFFKQLRKR